MIVKAIYNLLLLFLACILCIMFTKINYLETLQVHKPYRQNSPDETGAVKVFVDSKLIGNLTPETVWQDIDRQEYGYVYSAFIMDENTLTIVGAAKRKGNKQLFCQLWTKDETTNNVTRVILPASVTILPEHHGCKYKAVLFKCSTKGPLPFFTHVSLITNKNETALNLLKVRNISMKRKYENKYIICCSPLFVKMDRIPAIVEWIELNRILGAEKFVFYDFKIDQKITKLLNFYIKQGIVELLPWKPGIADAMTSKIIHSHGQMAAMHDCFYRYGHISEFIVILDIDEFLIPHAKDCNNWNDLIKKVGDNFTTYLFRSAFFPTPKSAIRNSYNIHPSTVLHTINRTKREVYVYPPRERSKYIVRSTHNNQLKIHYVQGSKTYIFSTDTGLLHHYRNGMHENPTFVTDTTLPDKYSQELIGKVKHTWDKFISSKSIVD